MKNKSYIPVLFVFVSILFVASVPVLAKESSESNVGGFFGKATQKWEEVKNRIMVMKQERTQLRCGRIGERVKNRVTNYTQNRATHRERFERVKDRLSDIADKLEEKGFDVSTLRSDISTLEVLLEEYALLYAEFISALDDSEDLVCDESEGKYRGALQGARTKLQEVKQKRAEIREYYTVSIRGDIQELRNQNRSTDLVEEN